MTAIYRYLPLDHQLVLEFSDDMLLEKMIHAFLVQTYPGRSAVTFIWVALPYLKNHRHSRMATIR
ncbi:hypothetical protein [Desulfocicer niacini]